MASINDVARLAGVSTATVSRVISTPHLVTQQTRLKVIAAISQSGYVGNAIARSLRISRSNTVLVLIPNIANSFFSAVVQGIEQTAQRTGYRILLSEAFGKSVNEYSYVKLTAQKQADGIICLGYHTSFDSDFADLRSPVVMTCEYQHGSNMPIVRINNELAAEEICTYLLDQGHQRIGYINGPLASYACQRRHQGYKNALAKAGIKYDSALIALGDYSFQSGIKAMQNLLASRPSAIFAASDIMAMGAIKAAKLAGLRVPTQLSVAGFDDIDFSQLCDPPLTTVRQPRFQIGQHAMDTMSAILQGEEPEENEIVLPHKIIVRESTQRFSPNRPIIPTNHS